MNFEHSLPFKNFQCFFTNHEIWCNLHRSITKIAEFFFCFVARSTFYKSGTLVLLCKALNTKIPFHLRSLADVSWSTKVSCELGEGSSWQKSHGFHSEDKTFGAEHIVFSFFSIFGSKEVWKKFSPKFASKLGSKLHSLRIHLRWIHENRIDLTDLKSFLFKGDEEMWRQS